MAMVNLRTSIVSQQGTSNSNCDNTNAQLDETGFRERCVSLWPIVSVSPMQRFAWSWGTGDLPAERPDFSV